MIIPETFPAPNKPKKSAKNPRQRHFPIAFHLSVAPLITAGHGAVASKCSATKHSLALAATHGSEVLHGWQKISWVLGDFFPSVEDNWCLPTDVQLIFLSWGILGLFTRFMTSLDTSNDYLVRKKSHQWRFTFLGVRCSLNFCEKAGLFSFGVRDNIPGISHAAQDSLGRQSRNSTCRVELSIPTTSPSA